MSYTNGLDDPSAYFHVNLHSGNGTDNTDITFDANAGDFQPDFIWFKGRTSSAIDHALFDSSRGTTKILNSNQTNAENTQGATLKVFNSNGFRVGDDAGDYGVNASGRTYVTWNWKANGGTTSSNSDGSITSTVQANTTAGFSIVTYTGNGSDNATVGHGLGVKPKVIIPKRRDSSSHWLINDWSGDYANKLKLNDTEASSGSDSFVKDASSTTFTLGTDVDVNASSGTYIAYCFAEIQGYSKFGSYTGNGNADGPFIYTGFKPAWLMIKRTDAATDGWYIFDSTRTPFNLANVALRANSSNVESGESIDLLSNGFKHRIGGNNNFNNASGTYIYMAFAEHPFVTSGGVPATAR